MTYREARKRAGLTLEKVGNELGVSKVAVLAWEQGKANPQVGKLKKLSALYGVSIDELLKGGEDDSEGT